MVFAEDFFRAPVARNGVCALVDFFVLAVLQSVYEVKRTSPRQQLPNKMLLEVVILRVHFRPLIKGSFDKLQKAYQVLLVNCELLKGVQDGLKEAGFT